MDGIAMAYRNKKAWIATCVAGNVVRLRTWSAPCVLGWPRGSNDFS